MREAKVFCPFEFLGIRKAANEIGRNIITIHEAPKRGFLYDNLFPLRRV